MQSPLLGHVAPVFSGANLLGGARCRCLRCAGTTWSSTSSPAGAPVPAGGARPVAFAYEQAHKRGGRPGQRRVPRQRRRRRAQFLVSNGDLWPAVADPGGAIAAALRRDRPADHVPGRPGGPGHRGPARARRRARTSSRPRMAEGGRAVRRRWLTGRRRLPLWARVTLPLVVARRGARGRQRRLRLGGTVEGDAACRRHRVDRALSVVHRRLGGAVERVDGHGRAAPDRAPWWRRPLDRPDRAGPRLRIRAEHPARPARRRGDPVIWIVPLVLTAGAVVGVGVLFWRRPASSALRGRAEGHTGDATPRGRCPR